MSSDKTAGAPSRGSGQPDRKAEPEKKAPAKKAAPVARAGGHVDRGDGNGWVLEEE